MGPVKSSRNITPTNGKEPAWAPYRFDIRLKDEEELLFRLLLLGFVFFLLFAGIWLLLHRDHLLGDVSSTAPYPVLA
jgi:hypothetical protein